MEWSGVVVAICGLHSLAKMVFSSRFHFDSLETSSQRGLPGGCIIFQTYSCENIYFYYYFFFFKSATVRETDIKGLHKRVLQKDIFFKIRKLEILFIYFLKYYLFSAAGHNRLALSILYPNSTSHK